jgi:hypothetical protein
MSEAQDAEDQGDPDRTKRYDAPQHDAVNYELQQIRKHC